MKNESTPKFILFHQILFYNSLNYTTLLSVNIYLQVELPDLLESDEYCIAELRLRKKNRLDYPGACSLEFQSLMQILIETLFKWDVKNQTSKGVGIFGTVIAYAPADEEPRMTEMQRTSD